MIKVIQTIFFYLHKNDIFFTVISRA